MPNVCLRFMFLLVVIIIVKCILLNVSTFCKYFRSDDEMMCIIILSRVALSVNL